MLGCFGLVRVHRTRRRAACGAAGKWQQSDVAGALDGNAEPTLVTGANTGHAARKDLAALLHELRKNVGALVVDEIDLFDTELADFLFAEKLALAAAWSAGTATWTAGAAFAATAATGTTFAASTTAAVSTMTTVTSAWAAAGPPSRRGAGDEDGAEACGAAGGA